MGVKMGFEAKAYICVAGIGGTPSWTELSKVKDVTLNMEDDEADASTRANGSWAAVIGGLRKATIEFEAPWDTSAPGFAALLAAYINRTALGLAVMDGPIATAGSEGLWADCAILKCVRKEGLGEIVTASITAKPTYSDNPPDWKTIGA